ncbi:MAG TPA: AMP-binding protein [Streptosporangiaceae bacterium]|nr:AMP-binding protein [Streptosporangiaceae bacterium]
MTDAWTSLIRGERWRSPARLWIEDDIEYSWQQVGKLAETIEDLIGRASAIRVVRIKSESKLGCFAGQLAAWRAGCVAVADDGGFGPGDMGHVRPDVTVAVFVAGQDWQVQVADESDEGLHCARIPAAVVAVNFTSGSTGNRKAVAVTSSNLVALFGCRDLDVPVRTRLTAGSFATPAYDGWWFDTWRTVFAGGQVVCLPSMNQDVFTWAELAGKYHIDRVLLPAAVIAAIVETAPECVASIPWLFSGGEQFQVTTYRQARQAGLRNRFVNLYGPTEATFATHKYELPESFTAPVIPIGKPLDGCQQILRDLDDRGDSFELLIGGPFVCHGYFENGVVSRLFLSPHVRPLFHTGDVVRSDDDGNLVFAGRLDNQIKVNGIRVDAAALEHQVTGLPDVLGCRVVQDDRHTVVFVRAGGASPEGLAVRSRIESVVKSFSPAIKVAMIDRFPTKTGGKVDTVSLMRQHRPKGQGGEK